MTKGDIYKLFTEQVMKMHFDAVFTYTGTGGCESCGHGSDRHECIACGSDGEREYSGSSIAITHRPGCSVPLILAEQHEAGLHDE